MRLWFGAVGGVSHKSRLPHPLRWLRKVGFHERKSIGILILDVGSQNPHPFDFAQGRLSFRKGREKKDGVPGTISFARRFEPGRARVLLVPPETDKGSALAAEVGSCRRLRERTAAAKAGSQFGRLIGTTGTRALPGSFSRTARPKIGNDQHYTCFGLGCLGW